MSLVLKKNDEINLFSSVVSHVSFCIFLTLLIIRSAAIAINIIIYVIGDIISTFAKQFIMIATERSTSIAQSCLVVVEFLAMSYIKYIDFTLNEEQKQKVSSEQNSIKTILANASKRVQAPVKKEVVAGVISSPNSNSLVVPAEFLKKSEAARQTAVTPANKSTEASPSLSVFAELSLKKAEKEQLPLEQRYRPSIMSSLRQNRPNDCDYYPSKRYSTPASEKQKRTTTMKLINSTAANRLMKNKKQRQEVDEIKRQNSISNQKQVKPELKDKNLSLFDERPSFSQPPRTLHLNKTPEMNLQVARRFLKVMIRVRKHRSTI